MSDFFNASEGQEKKPFEIVPEGKHPGVLRFVVDCGHHRDTYQGASITKHILFIAWELPKALREDGTPHFKGNFFTVTDFINSKTQEAGMMFGKASKFSKLLRSWTGKDENEVKWMSFLASLVQTQWPAFVVVDHQKDKNDPSKIYSNILTIKPYDGKDKITRIGDFVTYKFNTNGRIYTVDENGYEDLPPFLKKKIEKSIEATEGRYELPTREQAPSSNVPF